MWILIYIHVYALYIYVSSCLKSFCHSLQVSGFSMSITIHKDCCGRRLLFFLSPKGKAYTEVSISDGFAINQPFFSIHIWSLSQLVSRSNILFSEERLQDRTWMLVPVKGCHGSMVGDTVIMFSPSEQHLEELLGLSFHM